MLSIIPDSSRPAVVRALQSAFGRSEPDAIEPMTGGLSGAGAYRIAIDGRGFLLRLDGPPDPLRDPDRWHVCMNIAAKAGVAPAIVYASVPDRVTITDFIVARPRPASPNPGRGPRIAAMAAVRTLHYTEPFPPLVDYFEGVQALFDQFHERRLFAPSATAELADRFDALARAYVRNPADQVSSHNDLNPGNIIHDGTRVWFVDWEAAFLADRYVDLSCLANWFCQTQADESGLLTAYFGAEPTERQRGRMTLMRAVNHLFCGLMFANMAGAEQPTLTDLALEAPPLSELMGPFGPALGTPAERLTFGTAQLRQAIEDFSSDRFAEAMAAAG